LLDKVGLSRDYKNTPHLQEICIRQVVPTDWMGAQVLDILSINHNYVVICITTQNKNTYGCGKQKTVPDYNDTTSYSRWYHSLNEYVVRTGHQENINRNESEPDNDYVACEYSEVQVIINKCTNFRCLSGYSKMKKLNGGHRCYIYFL
jgi:hypothetical protein